MANKQLKPKQRRRGMAIGRKARKEEIEKLYKKLKEILK